ncbi:hypothetical protein [Candidatus Magnetomonas plexicatena]|uniref:hypothetical protein n=1 Tax=Candidatus Magnetomonas plexicatena TaxID=2552947 RepID=UPI001103F427|nr:hypothetical protein E2O03_009835 [Nitrospirales bacterium LBB_01]
MAEDRKIPKSAKLADIKFAIERKDAVKVPVINKFKMTEELADWSKWIKDNPAKAAKIVRQWLESEEK